MKYTTLLCRYSIVLLLGCTTSYGAWASPLTEKTRTIKETFEVDEFTTVDFRHRRGDLTVKHVSGSTGTIELKVIVRGEVDEDMQQLLDAIEADIDKSGNNVSIKTQTNIVSWSSSSWLFKQRHKIVLKNGKTINTKIDDLKIEAVVSLPKLERLSLNQKYDDIIIDELHGKLNVDLHSATLQAGDLTEYATIKVKYGRLDVGNLGDAQLDIYDAKGEIRKAGNVLLKDKYSTLKIGDMTSLKADIFDSDIRMGNISGNADIKDKYSKIEMGTMQDGTWDFHDSDIELVKAGTIRIKSKYSEFKIEQANKLIVDSHDDNFDIIRLGTLESPHSKYSEYTIEKLDQALSIDDSHDDKFRISVVSAEFKGARMSGKYTDLDLPLPRNLGFTINAKLKYGQLNYPEEGFEQSKYIKDGSDLEVVAKSKSGKGEIMIKLDGHDCNINLKG